MDLMLPTDPLFYVVGLTTIFLVSVGKGAFGGGLAILGVPLLSLVLPPLDAAIVVAPLVTFMDFFAFGSFGRKTWSKPDLVWLAPAMLVGIALGYVFFVYVDPRVVAAGIGVITLVFALDWFLRGRKSEHKERPVSPLLALIAGSATGFTTFVAHAGGPPMSAYLLYRGLNKTVYAGTAVALFSLGNLVKLVPYAALAFAKPETLVQAAVLAPVVPLGVWLGKYIHDRLDQQRLFFWCYAILIVAAAKLLYDALRAF
jgi:uncharacterized membrane protein YfcA